MKQERKEHQGPPKNKYQPLVRLFLHNGCLRRKVCERLLMQTGVFPSQHRLLMEVALGKTTSQKELAERMEVSPATIAVTLKKLEKNGYIQRGTKQEDNRFNQIAITDKGKKIMKESGQIFDQLDKVMFDRFSDEELQQLKGYMEKIYENLSNAYEDEIQKKKAGKPE